jgi:hypothetical protein
MVQRTLLSTANPQLRSRIRGEYREMPGLCLTTAQAARLWHLALNECDAILRELTREGFLQRVGDRYVRADLAVAC